VRRLADGEKRGETSRSISAVLCLGGHPELLGAGHRLDELHAAEAEGRPVLSMATALTGSKPACREPATRYAIDLALVLLEFPFGYAKPPRNRLWPAWRWPWSVSTSFCGDKGEREVDSVERLEVAQDGDAVERGGVQGSKLAGG